MKKLRIDLSHPLFGFVDVLGATAWPSGDDITRQPNGRLEVLYDKLLADSNIEKYLDMNLGADMEVEYFNKKLSEYEVAKELAIQEASETTDISDVEHNIEKKETAGDVMEDILHKWNAQKNDFYVKTNTNWTDQIVATEDNFDKELENILGE